MFKKYNAIFFDWDGTAVLSRTAPVDRAVNAMRPLLKKGIKLVIVSGTTIENIADGKIESYFTEKELSNLYLGLGRGGYNYEFINGKPHIFKNMVPSKEELLKIHKVCFEVHQELKRRYDFDTDIIFSRPNYCKVDLMVNNFRDQSLFMQESEVKRLRNLLQIHGMTGGLKELIELAEKTGCQYGVKVKTTCDAKYLEIGNTSKSDNVDCILEKICLETTLSPRECVYLGDEYVGIEKGIFGSDSFMRTKKSIQGDFFDVSEVAGERPEGVKRIGGGVETFLHFLKEQAE